MINDSCVTSCLHAACSAGGDLPPEIQAQLDSGELKLPKGELQSLRNYYKVRKWTRGVDIFAKDYIFVPIHDALHWSLVVLCHPGKDLGAGASARKPNTRKSSNSRVISDSPGPSQEGLSAAGGSSEADMVGDDDGRDADPRAAPQQEAFMLHLDSIRGAHSTSKYASTLRQYLTNEWKSKAADPIAPPDCIPKMWAAANPTEAARGRSFKEMKAPSVQVPSQDNHCDCGLFVCAFADFFLEAMPPGLSIAAVDKLYKDYSRDGRDLYEPACGTEGTDGTAVVKGYYPGFLTQHWFPVANGSNLRWEMSIMVLHHMAVSLPMGACSFVLPYDFAHA